MILRRAFKLTLPSPSNTWKKLPTKSRPLETSSTSLNGSIALNKTTLRLVCGVDVHHVPLAVTVLHQMFVSDRNENLNSNPQSAYFITHELCQVSSTLKGIFVYLDLSPPVSTPASPKRLRFQADSGFSCNTIHVTDLNKLSLVRVDLSSVRLLDYTKSVIPTSR